MKWWKGMIYFLYFFSFLFGSFASSYLIEIYRENRKLNVFVIPTLIEVLILISIPIAHYNLSINPNFLVCIILFAMGLQNSLVTKISNAIVRTTHLTGLFTDLGIELSQLFFPKTHPQRKTIKRTIKLRIFIISFFFLGGIFGGFVYSNMEFNLNTLIFPAIILILSLFYDDMRFQIIRAKRRYRNRKSIA